MAINKLTSKPGKILGVANCASAGAQKVSQVTATCTSKALRSGTRLVEYLAVAGGGGGVSTPGGGYGGGGAGAGGMLEGSSKAQGNLNIQISGGS
jgi:hypothetical protein